MLATFQPNDGTPSGTPQVRGGALLFDTCVSGVDFAQDGSAVLANYMNGRIYLFDIEGRVSENDLATHRVADFARGAKRAHSDADTLFAQGGSCCDLQAMLIVMLTTVDGSL